MGVWSLGSVSDAVNDLVDDVPSSITTKRMLEMADQKREYVEQYTGASIGSNSIALQFQGPIIKLTAAETLNYMQLIGADVSSVKLGDFSEKKGADSNLNTAADNFNKLAMNELNAFGRDIRSYKSNG